MKASELRIGNYLKQESYINGNDYKVVLEIQREKVVCADRQVTGISYIRDGELTDDPIPLSEDWVKRLGFEFDLGGWHLFLPGGVRLTFAPADSRHDIDAYIELSVDEGQTPLLHVNHVHELQNLHYSLTGEELEIKRADGVNR